MPSRGLETMSIVFRLLSNIDLPGFGPNTDTKQTPEHVIAAQPAPESKPNTDVNLVSRATLNLRFPVPEFFSEDLNLWFFPTGGDNHHEPPHGHISNSFSSPSIYITCFSNTTSYSTGPRACGPRAPLSLVLAMSGRFSFLSDLSTNLPADETEINLAALQAAMMTDADAAQLSRLKSFNFSFVMFKRREFTPGKAYLPPDSVPCQEPAPSRG